jgi:hypothetical protein
LHPELNHYLTHPRFRAGPWKMLPIAARADAARYVVSGATMRPFMRAVAAGDLYAANRMHLVVDIRAIAEFFEHMPERCHGDYTRVAEWEMIGGLRGIDHLNENLARVLYD